jgi:hypothetical protein
MARSRDQVTPDLFEMPCAPAPVEGSLNYDVELRAVLSAALKKCHETRYIVAARMSELTGEDISKAQLDAWTAESKTPWRFPFAYAAAFEAATGTNVLQELLSRKRGTRVLIGATLSTPSSAASSSSAPS